jgi:protein-S-isoprenylcysteine O-methyltransferase Ste14
LSVSESVQVSRRKFWMRWRVRAGYFVAVVYWLLAAPTLRSIAYGAIVAAAGLAIRAAASGYLHKDRELATSGPYAWTRNPLYFGSAFLAAGFIVAGHSWMAGVLIGIYFGVFYYAVMRNEERDLRARFGAVFDDYARRVPLFFPWPGKKTDAQPHLADSKFSLAQYRRNREYQALIGTIAGLAILVVRMWIRARFGR